MPHPENTENVLLKPVTSVFPRAGHPAVLSSHAKGIKSMNPERAGRLLVQQTVSVLSLDMNSVLT